MKMHVHVHTDTYAHTYIIHTSYIHHTCMHACIHAYMHTCIHAYMHTYIHTYIHTYLLTYLHTYIHTYIIFKKACDVFCFYDGVNKVSYQALGKGRLMEVTS